MRQVIFILFCTLSSNMYGKPMDSYGFIENKGQVIDQNYKPNHAVRYLWRDGNLKLQLKTNSFSYELTEDFTGENDLDDYRRSAWPKMQKSHERRVRLHRIDVTLIGANQNPSIVAEGKSSDYINYYTTGTPIEGVTEVHHFNRVTYKNIYPFVDLEFVVPDNMQKGIKYNFIVHPGGDLSAIRILYQGAGDIRMENGNYLSIQTTLGNLTEELPQSYEYPGGKQVPVVYKQIKENIFALEAGEYDRSKTLVIDPWVTYFGVDGSLVSVATDLANNVLAGGQTYDVSGIATTGSFQDTFSGLSDAVFAKFDMNGTRIWSTYYGGVGSESISAITADLSGNIFVGGTTTSDTVMATAGSFQPFGVSIQDGDGFLAKFNASGMRIWGTYYDGTISSGVIEGLATDAWGNVIAIGVCGEGNGISTTGAHQEFAAGQGDAFLVKFDSSGVRQWGSFYGGSGYDEGFAIATDSSGNIAIAGYSESSTGISTAGAFQTTGTGHDLFLAHFNAAGVRQWGTYFCPTVVELIGIDIDADGNIAVAGSSSTGGLATAGAHQAVGGGMGDAVVSKFDSSGAQLWCTYYGGAGFDLSSDIAFDDSGNVFLTGFTLSPNEIATPGSYQTMLKGSQDGMLVKFDADGVRKWGTYIGGAGTEISWNLATDGVGNAIIVGYTTSQDSISTPGAFQTAPSPSFIASFSPSGSPLHIHLTTLTATNHGSRNLVQWRTASEDKGDYFELERSADGKSFAKLAMIQGSGAGNGSGSGSGSDAGYSYTDEHPFTGINYYRLKLYDASGSFQYSQVVTATLKAADAFSVEVFPNPVTKEEITVKTVNAAAGAAKLVITDVNGRVVKSLSLQQSTTVISLKGIPAGVYLLQYEDGEHKASVKLVRE